MELEITAQEKGKDAKKRSEEPMCADISQDGIN
jgi:hypothetical protein